MLWGKGFKRDFYFSFNKHIKGHKYLLEKKAKNSKSTIDILSNLANLDVDEFDCFSFKSKLDNLLEECTSGVQYQGQNSKEFISSGLLKMYDIMYNNMSYVAAPENESERQKYYQNLAKGYYILTEAIEKQYKENKIDKMQLYSCIDTIGDGGHACAGRWRQVLEEMVISLDDKVKETLNIAEKSSDKLNNSINDIFVKAKIIETNQLAEEFYKTKLPEHYMSASLKLHYITFFKRFVNNHTGISIPTTPEEDSLIRNIDYLNIWADSFLSRNNLKTRILNRATKLLEEEVASNTKLYNEILEWGISKYSKLSEKSQYEDSIDYLSSEVFDGYEKKLKSGVAQLIFQEKGFIENKECNIDLTPKCLFVEASSGNLDNVKSLIENNVNMNYQNSEGDTPLMIAIKKGFTGIAKELIQNGADLNIKNIYNVYPITKACEKGNIEIVDEILNKNSKQLPPASLYVAINADYPDIAIKLIRSKIELNFRGGLIGNTPLLLAIKKGFTQVARELIQNGADLDITDSHNISPFLAVCCKGNMDIFNEILIKDPQQLNPIALYGAVFYGNKDIASTLILNKIDLNFRDKITGNTPLMLAIKNENTLIAKELIQNGADLNITDNNNVFPLAKACEKGNMDIVNEILKKDGRQLHPVALFSAIDSGNTEIASKLILNKIDLNYIDAKTGYTPLMIAIDKGFTQVAIELIRNGADLDIPCNDVFPLTKACEKGNMDVVDEILKKDGRQLHPVALYAAINSGNTDIANKLIQNKIDLNYIDIKTGYTPLKLAIRKGNIMIAKELIKNGADLNNPVKHNIFPFNLFRDRDYKKFIKDESSSQRKPNNELEMS